jgi:hypothetical protein
LIDKQNLQVRLVCIHFALREYSSLSSGSSNTTLAPRNPSSKKYQ